MFVRLFSLETSELRRTSGPCPNTGNYSTIFCHAKSGYTCYGEFKYNKLMTPKLSVTIHVKVKA